MVAAVADAKAVVAVAAPSDPAHVTGLFADHLDDIRKHGQIEVSLAGRNPAVREVEIIIKRTRPAV